MGALPAWLTKPASPEAPGLGCFAVHNLPFSDSCEVATARKREIHKNPISSPRSSTLDSMHLAPVQLLAQHRVVAVPRRMHEVDGVLFAADGDAGPPVQSPLR